MTSKQDENKENEARPRLDYEINPARIMKTDWPDRLPYAVNVIEKKTPDMQREKLPYPIHTLESMPSRQQLDYAVNSPSVNLAHLYELLVPEFIESLPKKVAAGEVDNMTLINIVDSIFNRKYKNLEYIKKKPEKNIMR